jgi:hypothetical protein
MAEESQSAYQNGTAASTEDLSAAFSCMELDDIRKVLCTLPKETLSAMETHMEESLKKHVYARSLFHKPYNGFPMPIMARQVATLDELYSKRCSTQHARACTYARAHTHPYPLP